MDNSDNATTHPLKDWIHPTGEVPEKVIMLLLGESKKEYANIQAVSHQRAFDRDSEIWTCNAGFRIWRHDLLFLMDDLEGEAYKWPQYGTDLIAHSTHTPIITSTVYPSAPLMQAFPYGAVVDKLRLGPLDRYFTHSLAYMLAYACAIGVKHVTIFGADHWTPAHNGIEVGLANTEWWLGFCIARGMHFSLARGTTLMGLRANGSRPTYGYRLDPNLDYEARRQADADERLAEADEKIREADRRLDSLLEQSAPFRKYIDSQEDDA